jgi:hypothetical protein
MTVSTDPAMRARLDLHAQTMREPSGRTAIKAR